MEKKRIKLSILVLAVGCALSFGLALTKLLVGLSCNSLVILLDSTNSFFDIATGLVAIVAFCLLFAQKSEKHPFGWGRSEYLAGFVVAAVTVGMGVMFLLQALNRLTVPEPVYFGVRNCILICVAWVVKAGMAVGYFLVNRRLRSKAIRALLLDSFADIGITTVSIVSFTVSSRVSYAVDAWLGIAVSITVMIFGIRLIIENTALVLGKGDIQDERKAVQDAMADCPAVKTVRTIRLHDYGYHNKYGYVEVEPTAATIADFVEQTRSVREALQEKGIHIEIVPVLEQSQDLPPQEPPQE